jgi:hypothetical protein
MLETIGFLVWIVATMVATMVPILFIATPDFDGRGKKDEIIIGTVFALIAAYSWYKIFSSITITVS